MFFCHYQRTEGKKVSGISVIVIVTPSKSCRCRVIGEPCKKGLFITGKLCGEPVLYSLLFSFLIR